MPKNSGIVYNRLPQHRRGTGGAGRTADYGGEPTFVCLDDPESPQWNIDALGDMKRSRGLAFIRALRERMAPHALLHYGQGKWYPGEPLPRWALSCFWRADGVRVWEDTDLIALENHDYGFATGDAFRSCMP